MIYPETKNSTDFSKMSSADEHKMSFGSSVTIASLGDNSPSPAPTESGAASTDSTKLSSSPLGYSRAAGLFMNYSTVDSPQPINELKEGCAATQTVNPTFGVVEDFQHMTGVNYGLDELHQSFLVDGNTIPPGIQATICDSGNASTFASTPCRFGIDDGTLEQCAQTPSEGNMVASGAHATFGFGDCFNTPNSGNLLQQFSTISGQKNSSDRFDASGIFFGAPKRLSLSGDSAILAAIGPSEMPSFNNGPSGVFSGPVSGIFNNSSANGGSSATFNNNPAAGIFSNGSSAVGFSHLGGPSGTFMQGPSSAAMYSQTLRDAGDDIEGRPRESSTSIDSDVEPQMLVKNTFISLKNTGGPRNRTESADVVMLGASDKFNPRIKDCDDLFGDGFTVFENYQFVAPEDEMNENQDERDEQKGQDEARVCIGGNWTPPRDVAPPDVLFPSYPLEPEANSNLRGKPSTAARWGIGKTWDEIERETRNALAKVIPRFRGLEEKPRQVADDSRFFDGGAPVVELKERKDESCATMTSASVATAVQKESLVAKATIAAACGVDWVLDEVPPMATDLVETNAAATTAEPVAISSSSTPGESLEGEAHPSFAIDLYKTKQQESSVVDTRKRGRGRGRRQLFPAATSYKLPAGVQLSEIPEKDLPHTDNVKTTVMLRNIPNKYTQKMLLGVIDKTFVGLYDFYYLPIDFRNKCNVGYAFVNFIHPFYAEHFRRTFHGYKLDAFKSNKICEVGWGRVQGLKANIEHYRNSAVMSVPLDQYKPMLFCDGEQIPFPDADGPLPCVKPRPQKC